MILKVYFTYGTICRQKVYIATNTGSYDEIDTLTQSGNDIWFSGISFPINPRSPTEATWMEQGKVKNDDLKFYINGNVVQASGNFKIQIGSPTGENYEIIHDLGVQTQKIGNNPVYHKMFLTKLDLGSLQGE